MCFCFPSQTHEEAWWEDNYWEDGEEEGAEADYREEDEEEDRATVDQAEGQVLRKPPNKQSPEQRTRGICFRPLAATGDRLVPDGRRRQKTITWIQRSGRLAVAFGRNPQGTSAQHLGRDPS